LSCIGKIYERLLYFRLYHIAEASSLDSLPDNQKWISHSQSGFRISRSVTDLLLRFSQRIADGFEASRDTVAVMLDISKAYDTVWHDGLLYKLHRLGLRGRLLLVLSNFLTSRRCYVRISDVLSPGYCPQRGVPQGSVLSTLLFIIYINDILVDLPVTVSRFLYADDITISVTTADRASAFSRLNAALHMLHTWSARWLLTFSAEKSFYTLFTRDVFDPSSLPPLTIGATSIPYAANPRLLGVTFDPSLRWASHISTVAAAARRKLNILRLFVGSCNPDRRLLRTLYLTFLRPTLEYACCVWSSASRRLLGSLTLIQNAALRLLTGAASSTPISVLEAETHIPCLVSRWDQFLLRCTFRRLRMPSQPAALYLRRFGRTRGSPYGRTFALLSQLYGNGMPPPEGYPTSPVADDPPWLLAPRRVPRPFSLTFRDFSRRLLQRWRSAYASDRTGAEYHSLRPDLIARWPHAVLSTRARSRCIFRLRTGHCNLGSCRRGRAPIPCPRCGGVDTVSHLLLHCRAFALLRASLFRRIAAITGRAVPPALRDLLGVFPASDRALCRIAELVAGFALLCRPSL
jgi:hypothetical protein